MTTIVNAKILTLDDSNPYIDNGYIIIDNGVIVDIGSGSPSKMEGEIIDAKNQYVMPGLINGHHHAYSSFARGSMFVADKYSNNFVEVLENVWWRLDKALTLESVKYSAYVMFIESIRNGVTTVLDHHASPYAAAGSLFAMREAADDVGIRSCLCYEVSDRDGDAILKEGIKENVDYINHCKKNNPEYGSGMFGMHASFTLSQKAMEECVNANSSTGAGYHVHVAEDIRDQYDCMKKYGKRLGQRLFDLGILKPNTVIGHGTYSSDHELEMYKEADITMLHNPESNMGNAVGVVNVNYLAKKGIRVGIGTDGYTSDILESIKVANVLLKHTAVDVNVGWTEIPDMLYKNNREVVKRTMGIKAGILEKGGMGDVIFMNYTPFTPLHADNYMAHILFGMTGRAVSTVIIGGKVIMKDFEIVAFDDKEIAAKSREVAQKIWDNIK